MEKPPRPIEEFYEEIARLMWIAAINLGERQAREQAEKGTQTA